MKWPCLITLLFLFFIQKSFADDDDCSFFKNCGGSTSSSSSKKSAPNVSSASRSNPTVIAKIKGFGIETLYLNHNPVEFSLVSGNGRFGTMVSSSSGENSFFGNRTPELEDDFLERMIEQKKFKHQKIQIGTGLSVINKKKFEWIVGGSGIYNKETKNYNFGYSTAFRIFNLSFSTYFYKDDFKFNFQNHYCYTCASDYSTFFNMNDYQERFSTRAMTAGIKLGRLSIDYAYLNTKFNFHRNPTTINIFSSALQFKRVLLNAAYRKEISDNPIVEENQIISSPIKTDVYFGIQIIPLKKLTLGIAYNQFLMDEYSFTCTLFF